MAIASSSSSVVPNSYKYDVFLSFRGVDTRMTFTSHLYAALHRKYIEAYIDAEDLERGEEISPTLLRTIKESKLSIVIFSENYASSRWCLEELVCIVECIKERKHIILPVFYGVDPTDVRHQKGSYANALAKHEKRYSKDITKRWRDALTAAANISGYSRDDFKLESKLVEEIVEKVLKTLSSISNSFDHDELRGLFGMDKHLQKMEPLLCLGSPNVRVIGIWGMGGIGKTTLAKTVLKRFSSDFEGCFFEDISKVEPHHLKYSLFSKLLGDENIDYMHSSFANVRLRRKTKLLLVLDNVADLNQLEFLFGALQFGVGSRVILTSRDKKFLTRADVIYKVEALSFHEALELFCWKAFGGVSPKTDFKKLSEQLVHYSQGNPLALTVLGSHLNSRSLRGWKSTLKKLEKAPDEIIDKVLKLSYDTLDSETKAIFLDIACCLQWEKRDIVESVLGDVSYIGIELLIEKSLITNEDGFLQTHDLLQQMAWKIVGEESKELRQRSRLYNAQDVYHVLKNNEGTPFIEVIFLDLSKIPKDICLKSNVFEELDNLRMLKIISGGNYFGNCNSKSIHVRQGLDHLPNSLRYLQWPKCPLKSLPSNFKPLNLVRLDMRCSKLKELPNEVVFLGNLKEIFLSCSEELIKLPDLFLASKLEKIYLDDCTSLHRLPNLPVNIREICLNHSGIEALPSSFGSLENICFLNLRGCKRLKSIIKLPGNLELLILTGCNRLESIPSVLLGLNLTSLELGYCNIQEIPDWLGSFSCSLTKLDLSRNTFERLPSSIRQLDKLCFLRVRHCRNLRHLPELPPSILSIDASGCTSLQTVGISPSPSLSRSLDKHKLEYGSRFGFLFYNCLEMEQSARDKLLNHFLTGLYNQNNISSWKSYRAVPTIYPGQEIPKWFSNQCEGSAATVTLPPNWLNNNFLGFASCVALEFEDSSELKRGIFISTRLCFKRNYGEEYYLSPASFSHNLFKPEEENVIVSSDHLCMWCNYDPNIKNYLKNLDAVEVSFDCSIKISKRKVKVKRCGIRMIYDQVAEVEYPISDEDYTISKGICQDLTLSSGSYSEHMIIPRGHDFSNMELQRLVNNPNSDYRTTMEGLCQDSTLFTGSCSQEIIPQRHGCLSSSICESYSGCLVSELIEEPKVITNQPEPSGTQTINPDAEESHMPRTRRFNLCGCLPVLSIIVEWKLNKDN